MTMVLKVDPKKLRKVVATSPKYKSYSFRVATKIKGAAIFVFESQQRKDNEWRLSNTTPPKYVASFRLEWRGLTSSWRVINDDPGWNWVEYGTHPGGGSTFIMRYRPLGRGLDIVAGGG